MMRRLDHEAALRMQAWLGIDISQATFDACLLVLRKTGATGQEAYKEKEYQKAFPNTPPGFVKLLRWVESLVPGVLASHACHFCMEATGAYSQALALFLAEGLHPVSVGNPARIKYSGMGEGAANKSDSADARRIAHYARKERPALWRMAQPEVRELVALMRRLENIKGHLTQEKNRSSVPGVIPSVQASLDTSIQFLEREIKKLEQEISAHIDRYPGLKADKVLLRSVPGIGETLAHWILAEMPDVSQFASAQSVAAYAGLNPRVYQSGTSVHKPTRITKAGNRNLRRSLYMPALCAIQHNLAVKELFDRLVAKGMARKAAVCAAMRKLLMLAYGVLKNRQIFDYPMAKKAT